MNRTASEFESIVLGVHSGLRDHSQPEAGPCVLSQLMQALGSGIGGRWIEWLQNHVAESSEAAFTYGFPSLQTDVQRGWFGERLIFWPNGIPERCHVSVASSRLGRRLEARREWFAALRTLCMRLNPDRDLLVCPSRAAATRFTRRCARLFAIPMLEIILPEDRQAVGQWFKGLIESVPAEKQHAVWHAFVSPELPARSDTLCHDRALNKLPLQDRIAVALGDRLYALHIRRNGNLHRLIDRRLNDTAWPVGRVHIATGPALVPEPLVDEFEQRGAVRWILVDESVPQVANSARSASTLVSRDIESAQSEETCLPNPSPTFESYLTHCTRRQDRTWPDQSEAEYLDDLILERDAADHSAFAALWRIVVQQRIAATSSAIRGQFHTVSLTAVPLGQLEQLRSFRPHRTRFDFEPYGLCVDRNLLLRSGARPVIYAEDEDWDRLPETNRPFFQIRTTVGRGGREVIDWSVEQEWRIVGDLDLSDVPGDRAFAFVPSNAEASQLRSVCRWPVVVVDVKESRHHY